MFIFVYFIFEIPRKAQSRTRDTGVFYLLLLLNDRTSRKLKLKKFIRLSFIPGNPGCRFKKN